MGHFFYWEPQMTYQVSKEYGFVAAESLKRDFITTLILMITLITIHHWMKWYKFIYSTLDNLSVEIEMEE